MFSTLGWHHHVKITRNRPKRKENKNENDSLGQCAWAVVKHNNPHTHCNYARPQKYLQSSGQTHVNPHAVQEHRDWLKLTMSICQQFVTGVVQQNTKGSDFQKHSFRQEKQNKNTMKSDFWKNVHFGEKNYKFHEVVRFWKEFPISKKELNIKDRFLKEVQFGETSNSTKESDFRKKCPIQWENFNFY